MHPSISRPSISRSSVIPRIPSEVENFVLPEEEAIYDTEQQIKRRERSAGFCKVCVLRMLVAQVVFSGSKKDC